MHIPALEGFGLEIVEQVAIPVDECTRWADEPAAEKVVG
jgi:hypothetical protein